VVVVLLLVTLQFTVRPFFGSPRAAPDFLLVALLVYAIRARPGQAAVAGFLVGLLADALSPAAFGAGALAHCAVAYLAAWGKAVFFADHLLVNAGFFFAGSWARDALVLLVGRHAAGSTVLWQLGFWSPLMALTTAFTGMAVLLLFRRWLQVRTNE
jgi:rod shape-determining protein MreD